jgi:mono/diheme cytochrome c family protein
MLLLSLLTACGDPALSLEGDPVAGETVFQTCAACHFDDGTGVGPAMGDEAPEKSDEEIVDIIRNGYEEMAPVALEDQEIADVLAYLRQEFGAGPP